MESSGELISRTTKVPSLTRTPNSQPFACPYPDCLRNFTRKSTLEDHIRGPRHRNEKPFKCEICHKAYTRANDLDRHKREGHGAEKFICEGKLVTGVRYGCGKRYSRETTLINHQKQCASFKNANLKESSEYNWPSVPESQLRHKAKKVLKKGQADKQWHHTSEEFVCKICQARRSKSRLPVFVQHLLDHLESIECHAFKCDACGENFALSEHLSRHNFNCGSFICDSLDDGCHLKLGWGCYTSFSSKEEYTKHVRGSDGSDCRRKKDISELVMKDCIWEQLRSLGVPQVKSDSAVHIELLNSKDHNLLDT